MEHDVIDDELRTLIREHNKEELVKLGFIFERWAKQIAALTYKPSYPPPPPPSVSKMPCRRCWLGMN